MRKGITSQNVQSPQSEWRVSLFKLTNKCIRHGAVNRCSCSVILDSGADITAVSYRFISESQYTGETVNISMANSQVEKWKLVKVRIEAEGSM